MNVIMVFAFNICPKSRNGSSEVMVLTFRFSKSEFSKTRGEALLMYMLSMYFEAI
jgi:hypothetical protein